jgi:hypothetical protein
VKRSVLGAGLALMMGALVGAAAAPPAPERDWATEARGAALESIRARTPDPGDVQFAGIKVRRTGGGADERWVCGSVAAWGEDGKLGPHRDFWLTVARVPGTRSAIHEVRANEFGRDDFFDRGSAHYRACFAGA